jgi:hypothetical protein
VKLRIGKPAATKKWPSSVELSVVVGIVSSVNRSQEVIDDKVGYRMAHAMAAGQIGAEVNAGKNST